MVRIGIDIGGTNIVLGILEKDGHIIYKKEIKTNLPIAPTVLADRVAALILSSMKEMHYDKEDIQNIGISMPGAIDSKGGIVVASSNFQYFDAPLVEMLESRIQMPCHMINDADAAALGEYQAYARQGIEDFVMITIGTGIGSGVILRGKLLQGKGFAAGEIGHMMIQVDGYPCTCGRYGCLEVYTSATALIRQTKEAMKQNSESLLWEIVQGDLNLVSGKTLFAALEKNDVTAQKVFKQYMHYFAVGSSNIIKILQPEVLCFGGGIANQGQWFVDEIYREYERCYIDQNVKERVTQFKVAVLGNDAGIIGAAFAE